jgi:error-prone DNA polymerase
MSLGDEMIEDYLSLRLSLRAHPMELLRPKLPGIVAHAGLAQVGASAGRRVVVAGLVITRQRPGTASGVVFITLEDETGVANVVVWKTVYAAFRKAVVTGRLLRVTGRVERDGAVLHVIAEGIEDMSEALLTLGRVEGGMIDPSGGRADETRRAVVGSGPRSSARHPREQAKVLFPSRDFH